MDACAGKEEKRLLYTLPEGGGHTEARPGGGATPHKEIIGGGQVVTQKPGPLPFSPKPSLDPGGFPQLVLARADHTP